MNIRANAIAVLSLLLVTAAPVSAEASKNIATDVRLEAGRTQNLSEPVNGEAVMLIDIVVDANESAQAVSAAKSASIPRVIDRLFIN